MTRRRMLMCLVTTACLCGAVSAAPPALPEGRELDPVARDFFLAGPTAPAPAPSEEATPAKLPPLSFLGSLREAIITKLSVPLGTVRPAGGSR